MEVLKDKIRTCFDCGKEFVLFVHEQMFFMRIREEKRKTNPKAEFHFPKRCPACRELRKHKKSERDRIHQIKLRQQKELEAAKNAPVKDDTNVSEANEMKIEDTKTAQPTLNVKGSEGTKAEVSNDIRNNDGN